MYKDQLNNLIKEHQELTDSLYEGNVKLNALQKDKFEYIANTDPKNYGSNEQIREARLKVKFAEVEIHSAAIKLLKLKMENVEFRLKALELLLKCSEGAN